MLFRSKSSGADKKITLGKLGAGMKSSKSRILNIVMTGIWAGLLFLYFTDTTFKDRLTSFVFKDLKKPVVQVIPKEQYRSQTERQEGPNFGKNDYTTVPNLEQAEKDASKMYPKNAIFSYLDNSGVMVMVDDVEKVPEKFRAKMKVSEGTAVQKTTPIDVVNRQAFVTVTFVHLGSTVSAKLLLDTGASGIVISPALAQRLGAQPTSRGTSILADGRKVPTYGFSCDSISVGAKSQTGAIVSIIPGNEEATGLLGMSFLAEFPHTVDLKAGVIRWL